MKLLAQQLTISGTTIQGPLDPSINNLGDLISRMLSFIMPLAAVILLFVLIWGGYGFMMSQGNPEKLKSAQARIMTGLIGFFILALAFLFVRLIATIFGLGTGLL